MMAATVGMAIGQNSDVTAEAAGVVVMDNSLEKVDEFMHISRRMRIIALQSAVGGMALSVIGMVFAATGHLSPVSGAITQEVIDVLAVLNALRAAFPPQSDSRSLTRTFLTTSNEHLTPESAQATRVAGHALKPSRIGRERPALAFGERVSRQNRDFPFPRARSCSRRRIV